MSENSEFCIEQAARKLAGVWHPIAAPVMPFAEESVNFLSDLGRELRRDPYAAAYTDVAAFGFWCRKANLTRMKESLLHEGTRIGRGTIFHIAPSNVPVNFAYSYALGLLAGNGNIVRVSSKNFPQTDMICAAMERIFDRGEYEQIRERTLIVSYDHDKAVTDYFSAQCDGRVIWGGDATIDTIRESKIPSRCVEIAFADRHSFGIIRPSAVLALDAEGLRQLAVNFFNDTYLMDQNACTAPHVIVWLTDSECEKTAAAEAQKCFWNAVYDAAAGYDLADIKVSDKYDALCNFIADHAERIAGVERWNNLLYVVHLEELTAALDTYRGVYGLFYDICMEDLKTLADKITKKEQTAAVLGVSREEICRLILDGHLQGIDRISSFGQTMDMEMAWDGYDLIGTLSRIIG